MQLQMSVTSIKDGRGVCEIKEARVKACNYTSELHALIYEVEMETFTGHVTMPCLSRITRGQQSGQCWPYSSCLFSTTFKRAAWKMQTDFVNCYVYLHKGIKLTGILRHCQMLEGNHKKPHTILIQLLTACFPFHCLSCTCMPEITLFTPACLVHGKLGHFPREELAHQEAALQPVCMMRQVHQQSSTWAD